MDLSSPKTERNFSTLRYDRSCAAHADGGGHGPGDGKRVGFFMTLQRVFTCQVCILRLDRTDGDLRQEHHQTIRAVRRRFSFPTPTHWSSPSKRSRASRRDLSGWYLHRQANKPSKPARSAGEWATTCAAAHDFKKPSGSAKACAYQRRPQADHYFAHSQGCESGKRLWQIPALALMDGMGLACFDNASGIVDPKMSEQAELTPSSRRIFIDSSSCRNASPGLLA